jgi:O-antigen ligase
VFIIALSLISLLIAPQLWVPPFVGCPTDYILYPLLFVTILQSGRLTEFTRLTTHDWLFLGLVTWIILGAIANGLTAESQYQIFLYTKFFLFYRLVITVVGNIERANKFIRIFIFLTIVLALEAIQQKLSIDGSGWANQGRAWIDPEVLQAGGVGRSRWIGIFDGPGVFCVLFTISLPFVLQELGKEFSVWRRTLSGILLLLLLGAIYATGSRGGLVASLSLIGLHGMWRTGVSMRAIVVSCGLALLIYSFAPAHLTTIRDQSHSGQHRVEMWAEGLDMVKEAPVFGIGRGNFQAYTSMLIAHNSAVQMVGETGLVGLFLWVGLIYVSVKGAVAYLKSTEKPEEKTFCAALILSVIGYLISALFVTLEYETFYLLLAICAVIARCVPTPVHLGMRDYCHIGAIVVAWVVILQIFVIQFFG